MKEKITMDGEYTTREGLAVELLCVGLAGTRKPVAAKVTIAPGNEQVCRYTECGSYSYSIEHEYDLIPKPKTVLVDCWMNVYAYGSVSVRPRRELCDTLCNSVPQGKRVACIRINREVAIGEGLTDANYKIYIKKRAV